MRGIGLLIALVISIRVCPQETKIDYESMTTVVVMENGSKIRCHEAVVNHDNTTSVIIHNDWGRKIRKINSSEIQNLLHIKDVQ